MSQARLRGCRPVDDEALDLVAEHHRGVAELWPVDAAAYHALGALLLDDPDQRALVAEDDTLLPPWLSAAVRAYAVRRLGHRPA